MNTVQVKRYEMGRNGGLVEIDTAKVANLPVGTVLHWGGNMGSPERDVCIVGVRPDMGYGGSYETFDIDEPEHNARLGGVEFSSVKRTDDPSVWHSQHYFITERTFTASEVFGFLAAHKVQSDALKEQERKQAEETAVKLEAGRRIFEAVWPKAAKYAIVAELIVDDSDIMTDYFADHAENTVILAPSMHDKNNFAEMRKACAAIPETACMMTGKGDFSAYVALDCDIPWTNGCAYWKGSSSHWHNELMNGPDGERLKFSTREEAQAHIDAMGKPNDVSFDGFTASFVWKIGEEDIEHRENYSGGKGYYLQRRGQPWRVRKVWAFGYKGTDKEPSEGFLLWLADRSEHLTKGATASASVEAQAPVTVGAAGAVLTENAEKGGLELRFPSRPASEVLDALKAGGWRWSKFAACWWIKASDEARTLATGITGE